MSVIGALHRKAFRIPLFRFCESFEYVQDIKKSYKRSVALFSCKRSVFVVMRKNYHIF